MPETPASPDRIGMSGIYRAPLHFKFLMPHSLTGLVLGYQGATVKTINRATGTFIQLTRPNTDTNSPEVRTMVMAAPSADSAANALRLLLDSISSGGGLSELEGPPGVIAPSGTMVLRMVIPQICAGTVVGPAGETVKGLGARHGVWAAVEARDPRAAFHPFRILVLAGDSHSGLAAAAANAMSLLALDSRYAGAIRTVNSTCFRTFPVPYKRVGLVMGAKGKHVQALQDMLRVKIGVTDAIDSRRCKHISVWGPVQSVEVAVQAINVSISTWDGVVQRQQRPLPAQSTANNQEGETDEATHQQITNDIAGYDAEADVGIAQEEEEPETVGTP